MELSNKELGEYLKTIREQLGYSIYDINKLCDISPSYISLMENGKRRPSPIILKKISSIYSLDCNDLYKKAGYDELIEYVTAEEWTQASEDVLKKIGAIPLSDIETTKIPILRNCQSWI